VYTLRGSYSRNITPCAPRNSRNRVLRRRPPDKYPQGTSAQALGSAKLAGFQRYAVHKIIIFGWRQGRNHALAEKFNLERKLPSPPVKDRVVNFPCHGCRQLLEQVVFRVNTCAFGSQSQGDQLFVGKLRDTDLVEVIILGFEVVQKAKNFVIT
jgi:hypothetical protein